MVVRVVMSASDQSDRVELCSRKVASLENEKDCWRICRYVEGGGLKLRMDGFKLGKVVVDGVDELLAWLTVAK